MARAKPSGLCRLDAVKSQRRQVQRIDKDIDHLVLQNKDANWPIKLLTARADS